MRPFPTFGNDSEPTSVAQRVIRDALGPILELDEDPTTSGNQLPNHGDLGYRGNNIFIRLGATIVKFSGTAT